MNIWINDTDVSVIFYYKTTNGKLCIFWKKVKILIDSANGSTKSF